MHILGIETSCDETAAAVVCDGSKILSNTIVSSLKEHSKFGGIIPEIASRRQLQYINAVVDTSLKEAKIKLSAIDAIAVTAFPGLHGSLLVGTSFAKALSYALNKPLILVDHIKAHIYANLLFKPTEKKIEATLPAIGLVVSGGHTSLYLVKSYQDFKLLGQTRDDAAGEAFDKVAKILNLGYPGGPVIDKLASKESDPGFKFKCAPMKDSHDFSFSGIKTAVLYHHRDNQENKDYNVNQVAYAFQRSVVDNLIKKSIEACLKFKTKTLLIGGGVAANSEFRRTLENEALKHNIQYSFPSMSLCTDNAAMIAGLGFHYYSEKGVKNA
ncbi:MAG: N6-L-threonylcarbamoyladenine synthase [Lysobacterales bacterium]|jgi:N6-L-threonylcarbamoyladenine synthase